MIYTIRKTYNTPIDRVIVEVVAVSEREALELANYTEGDVQNDDWLYDAEIIEEEGK